MNIAARTDQERRCLPASYYLDDKTFAADRQLLIDSWQLAGHQRQLPEAGDLFVTTIAGQEIFLVRGHDGDIRAFFNVCPHRGHQLVSENGNRTALACPYHAWTFGLDGAMRGMKRTATTEGPARSDICLKSIKVDKLAGFLFVNLSGTAQPLADFAPGLEMQIHSHVPGIDDLILEDFPALGHSYACNANWKALVDNFLECHHCGPAHHSFDEMMDFSIGRYELYQNYMLNVSPTAMKSESTAFPLNLEHDVTVGHFWWLFPNMFMGQFPGVPGFYASRIDPVTPQISERRSYSLIVEEPTDPDMMRRHQLRADWSANVLSMEDRRLCESVQRGMNSIGFEQGWYITDPEDHSISEHVMRYFHSVYLSAIHQYQEA